MARWELAGRLQVRETLTESTSQIRNLSGVNVKISGTTTGTKWREWKTVRTDAEGRFSLVMDKGNSRRRFKIKVFLEDQFLRVMRPRFLRVARDQGEKESAPIEVLRDENKRSGKNIDFGVIILDDQAVNNVERRHGCRAALWYTAKHISDELLSHDSWLGFDEQITIVYPSVWMTSGMGNRARIASDRFGSTPSYNRTDVIHEIMHIWNYQHNSGTTDWVTAGWNGTHNRQERPNIAFHEGFAQWASRSLQHLLWSGGQMLPANKFWVSSNNNGPEVMSLDEFERSDFCVESALSFLMHPTPNLLTFGSATASSNGTARNVAITLAPAISIAMICPRQSLDFWEVLQSFRGGQHESWPTDWDVGSGDFGLLRFFDRLSDIYPTQFPQESKDTYIRVLDPTTEEEFTDNCSPATRLIR